MVQGVLNPIGSSGKRRYLDEDSWYLSKSCRIIFNKVQSGATRLKRTVEHSQMVQQRITKVVRVYSTQPRRRVQRG